MLKQLSFPHKQMWKTLSSYFCKSHPQIIVEHTENSHNLRLYTIQHKSVRNSHLLFQKFGIFSSATSILLNTKRKNAHTQIIKAAINCSYVYCEEDYGKCYKHTLFFFKRTIVSTGATNAQITKTNKTYGYCKLQHKQI